MHSHIYLSISSLPFPSLLPLWKGFRTRYCCLMLCCLGLQSLVQPIFVHFFLLALFHFCFMSFFLTSYFPKMLEVCWEDERLNTSSVMNGLRHSTLKPRFSGLNGESICPLLENDCYLLLGGTDTSIFHVVHRLPCIKAILLLNGKFVSFTLLFYMIMNSLWV